MISTVQIGRSTIVIKNLMYISLASNDLESSQCGIKVRILIVLKKF
jgi:hypothetical protein